MKPLPCPFCGSKKASVCMCGQTLWTVNACREHFLNGCADAQQYATIIPIDAVTKEKTVNARDAFRTDYRPTTTLEDRQIKETKEKANALMQALKAHSPSRENSLAQTKLEECVMWAVKGITG